MYICILLLKFYTSTYCRSKITFLGMLMFVNAENIIPQSVVASFTHDIFIKGCQINFSIDGPNEIEVGSLYPDEPFQTMDECFNEFAAKIEEDKHVLGNEEKMAHHVVDVLTIPKLCAGLNYKE